MWKYDAEKASVYDQCETLGDFKRQRATFDTFIANRLHADVTDFVYKQKNRVHHARSVSHEVAYSECRNAVLERVRALETEATAAIEVPASKSESPSFSADSLSLQERVDALERRVIAAERQRRDEHNPRDDRLDLRSAEPADAHSPPRLASHRPSAPPNTPASCAPSSQPSQGLFPSAPSVLSTSPLRSFNSLIAASEQALSPEPPSSASFTSSPRSSLSAPCEGCEAWRAMYEQLKRHTDVDEMATTRRKLAAREQECRELRRERAELEEQKDSHEQRIFELEQHALWLQERNGQLIREKGEKSEAQLVAEAPVALHSTSRKRTGFEQQTRRRISERETNSGEA